MCTRWEFVQYLISTPPSSYDEHWIPVSASFAKFMLIIMLMLILLHYAYIADYLYDAETICEQVSIYCSPCSLQYTRILHSETIQVQKTTDIKIITTNIITIMITTYIIVIMITTSTIIMQEEEQEVASELGAGGLIKPRRENDNSGGRRHMVILSTVILYH